MNDLSSAVGGNNELLQVDVEIRPIAKVLSLINDHIKAQNRRISYLEDEIKTFVKKDEYDKAYEALISRISSTEDKMAQTISRFNALSSDVQNLESKFNKTLDEHLNDMLVTTNTKIRSASSAFDSQISILTEQIEQLKEKINKIEDPQSKVDLTVFGKFIKQNTVDIEELKQKINGLHSGAGNLGFNNGNNAKDFKEIDTSGLNLKITDNNSLLTQVNQQKAVLLELVSELNKVKEKMSMPVTAPPKIIETKTIIEERKNPVEGSPERKSVIVRNIGNGNLNTVQLETELSKLENDFDSHQSKVVAAMNAIQFELQQIREHGEGLAGLPPLNLANVVPSFFNNPSFTFSRVEEEESLDEYQSEDFKPEDFKPEDLKLGTLHKTKPPPNGSQITRQAYESDDSDFETPRRERRRDGRSLNKARQSPERPGTAEKIETTTIIKQEVDMDEIVNNIKKEFDFDSIKKSFNQYTNEHREAMSALDRKIDRDYVERLFDKFRSMIHSLNDRVKELAGSNSDYATRQDIQNVIQAIKSMSKSERPGTVLKKGPTCLFCGRPKATIAGSIPPNVAASAGRPPVRSLVGDGPTVEYVYGEGHAFRRDDVNFRSFPHFDALPPLAKETQSPGAES
ncbi:hypothetical protein TRFO_34089 [Tritrichomonas foetus]|uniref:Uncharacterized protein n=1 Tax=Tritrichomonas foetus TaxID=1144522 RepID=A0A1J4JPH4_9EUKA|nr:hypothetical protein TRFO_34089 [Tritrichomonas foetus]|eukprot:OHS99419.1 hypothetical protein TRFO_34089 [Tritrichomonas foetus]